MLKTPAQRGRKGGRARSEKKAAAVRENGKRGGRPRIQDEFTDLDLPRHQKYLLRRKRDKNPGH